MKAINYILGFGGFGAAVAQSRIIPFIENSRFATGFFA